MSLTEEQKDELKLLKERATLMGIAYSPNIGLDKLRDKVNGKIEGTDATEEPLDVQAVSKKEALGQKKARLVKEATVLKRCIVTCLDPKRTDETGEIVAVGNALIGVPVKKFIKFGCEYHVPAILYNHLKNKECLIPYQAKMKGTTKTQTKHKLIKAYAIQDLPLLTEKELKELASQQAANGSIDR